MTDRLASVWKNSKKEYFFSLKISRKIIFLAATKHPKNTLVTLFWSLNIFFFQVFPNCYQSIRHDESRKMRGMSDPLSRKVLSGDPFLSFVVKIGSVPRVVGNKTT